MSTPADIRLQRILDLEERQGWRNRGVIGGLQAMARRWAEDARGEGSDPALIAALTDLMERYGAATPETRPALALEMRQVLSGAHPTPAAVDDAPAPTVEAAPQAADDAGAVDAMVDADPVDVAAAGGGALETAMPSADEDAPLNIPPGDVTPVNGAASIGAVEPAPVAAGLTPQAPAEIFPGLGKVFEAMPDEDFPPPEPTHLARERQRRQQANAKRNPRDLQGPVTLLPGVGDATAEQLARLAIEKVIDLLWHLPARYDDFSALRTIDKLEPGEQVTVVANLWDVRERKVGLNRSMVQAIVGDSTGTLHATWWNKWIIRQLQPLVGQTLRFSGKIGLYRGQKTIENPAFEEMDDERVATGRMSPVYPLTEGLTNNRLRNMIYDALEGYARFLNDPLPAQVRHTYSLRDLTYALQQVHFPDDADHLEAARRRLAFEELFYIQLGVLQRRNALRQTTARALVVDEGHLQRYTALLPFALTGAQQRVVDEVMRDLERTVPMTRLIQGDVGSGKTAVAAAAMWIAAANGMQSALLAPTQVLAEQHHRSVSRLLSQLTRPDGAPVNVELLTGRVTGEARARVLQGLADGSIDVVVGTTAVIQETVEFAGLGLAIVDEQHRFGVEQRGVLRSKAADQPHLLVMSATPIPRSLALTLYGDLDVSRIDEMPPGRTEIKTKVFPPRERERLYNFIRREVAAGRQAYVVYPLVEESENLDAGAATVEHKRLQEEVFPDLRVALLHGRMTGTEKDEVMRAFSAGDYQALVSTTVIEVGIDVPNATVMVIEDAERFGLAQLHQLRGRVGRGQHAGYCALITRSEKAESRERLLFLTQPPDGNDGFAIAEKDLELRGPGDFLGTRQSGLPALLVAQLTDFATMEQAREAAALMFEQDPTLAQFPQLSRQVERFWRGHGDVS